jgi:hypothetical protein
VRQRPTHEATVHGEVVVGHDDLGGELTETQPVLDSPARVNTPDGQSFVPTATGEFVEENPQVVLNAHGYDPDTGALVETHERVETGMDVTLTGGTLIDDGALTFRIDSMQVKRRRGNIVERIELVVEKHT